jgi:hypothetical protein
LINKYQAYKNANEHIKDLIIQVEGIWIKTEKQLEILKSIVDSLDERLLNFQNACLERLERKLGLAILKLETLTDADISSISLQNLSLSIRPLKRLQYAAFEKSLRRSIDDLKSWHEEFDFGWYLIGRIADSNIDKALSKRPSSSAAQENVNIISTIREAIQAGRTNPISEPPVFVEAKVLSSRRTPLLNSNLELCSLSIDDTRVLLDTTAFDADLDKVRYTTHAGVLAQLLGRSRPETLGLLQCLGVNKLFNPSGSLSQFQFIYKITPKLSKASTLRVMLTQPSPSLDAKFRLARSLARSIMAVHSADFVHKNVRPETIVVFEDSEDSLPVSYLVGFERFRPRTAGTNLIGDMVWERNIYRFPLRQGLRPEQEYEMQHDIYSLGVCLLEIGMWTSFVTTTDPPQPGPRLDISQQLQLAKKEHLKSAWEIKKIFLEMAREFLPSTMGLVYTEVVTSCLTCLDQGATNLFAAVKDTYDADRIAVGVAFIEKVLMRLESVRFENEGYRTKLTTDKSEDV